MYIPIVGSEFLAAVNMQRSYSRSLLVVRISLWPWKRMLYYPPKRRRTPRNGAGSVTLQKHVSGVPISLINLHPLSPSPIEQKRNSRHGWVYLKCGVIPEIYSTPTLMYSSLWFYYTAKHDLIYCQQRHAVQVENPTSISPHLLVNLESRR